MFTQMGFVAFATRAERELVATGETVRKRSDETRGQLTPQESEIARIACEGLSNPEIGARLFISPRTVEWHLHKIFVKLAVHSRKELRVMMANAGRKTAAARPASWSELAGVAGLDTGPRWAETAPRQTQPQGRAVA
jgi:DNA-binding CsgD family transcriptional regulator